MAKIKEILVSTHLRVNFQASIGMDSFTISVIPQYDFIKGTWNFSLLTQIWGPKVREWHTCVILFNKIAREEPMKYDL